VQAQLLQPRRAADDGVHVPGHEVPRRPVFVLLRAEPALHEFVPAHALQEGVLWVGDGLFDFEGLQLRKAVGEEFAEEVRHLAVVALGERQACELREDGEQRADVLEPGLGIRTHLVRRATVRGGRRTDLQMLQIWQEAALVEFTGEPVAWAV
jgi:hypothetical protein